MPRLVPERATQIDADAYPMIVWSDAANRHSVESTFGIGVSTQSHERASGDRQTSLGHPKGEAFAFVTTTKPWSTAIRNGWVPFPGLGGVSPTDQVRRSADDQIVVISPVP